jgi:hypothetical protein
MHMQCNFFYETSIRQLIDSSTTVLPKSKSSYHPPDSNSQQSRLLLIYWIFVLSSCYYSITVALIVMFDHDPQIEIKIEIQYRTPTDKGM